MLRPRSDDGRSALRNALVALTGGLLVVAGFVGLLLPVPGVLLILMGLSLLSTRYAIARRWLESMQRGVARVRTLGR